MEPWSNPRVDADRELLARIARGDREALAPLIARHERRVYRIALGYLRNADDALDVVQETFVKAFENAGRFGGETDAGPWLARIAVNQAIDRYRREKRRRASQEPLAEGDHDQRLSSGEPSPERQQYGREARERIDQALLALPEKQRAIFVLRHHQQMSLEEIAEALGLRLGTVKSGLHRAIHELRHRLRELRP